MYDPGISARTAEELCRKVRYPRELREHTPAEIDEWTRRLADARGGKGETLRELTREENLFVLNELILSRSSYRYWGERYSFCSSQGAGIRRMFPLFDSQQLILQEIGRIEKAGEERRKEALAIGEPGAEEIGGVMVNVLKARRLGASTLAQSMTLHRQSLSRYVFAVVASDAPDQTSYTIGTMFKFMYDKLPWWLRPGLKFYSNTYPENYEFSNGCQLWGHSGQSTRGTEGDRGQIGRGKGVSVCHLTELSTWDATDQIDAALLPTMTPPHRKVLAIFESSPKGRNNWWHRHWQASMDGEGYFHPIFLPWYAEPRKYRMAAPPGWVAKDSTLAHARRAEEQGERWLHRAPQLSRDQLYWYERNRAYYERKDRLTDFQAEYAADPEECFVFSGRSLFSPEIIQRIEDQRRELLGVFEVGAMQDIGH